MYIRVHGLARFDQCYVIAMIKYQSRKCIDVTSS